MSRRAVRRLPEALPLCPVPVSGVCVPGGVCSPAAAHARSSAPTIRIAALSVLESVLGGVDRRQLGPAGRRWWRQVQHRSCPGRLLTSRGWTGAARRDTRTAPPRGPTLGPFFVGAGRCQDRMRVSPAIRCPALGNGGLTMFDV